MGRICIGGLWLAFVFLLGAGCDDAAEKTCTVQGVTYAEGSAFDTSEIGVGCKACTCTGGVAQCTEKRCTCSYEGKQYREGDTYPDRDGCNSSRCFYGRSSCSKVGCPKPCIVAGKSHDPNTTFPAPDGCNACTCLYDGRLECGSEPCALDGGTD